MTDAEKQEIRTEALTQLHTAAQLLRDNGDWAEREVTQAAIGVIEKRIEAAAGPSDMCPAPRVQHNRRGRGPSGRRAVVLPRPGLCRRDVPRFRGRKMKRTLYSCSQCNIGTAKSSEEPLHECPVCETRAWTAVREL